MVQVPKALLRRVKDEVESLREEVARLESELALARQRGAGGADDLQAELDERTAEARAYRLALEKVQAARDELAAELEETRALLADQDRQSGAERDELARRVVEADSAITELRTEGAETRAERDRLLRTHPAPPPDPARPGASPASDDPVGAAFTAWCRRGSPLASRSFLFESFLREGVSAEATVTPVFRDRHEPEPTFRNAPADGVEHWLVTVGPSKVLLPQPLSPTQFRELDPAFDGDAQPASVERVTSARVDGPLGALRLVERGRVEPQAP